VENRAPTALAPALATNRVVIATRCAVGVKADGNRLSARDGGSRVGDLPRQTGSFRGVLGGRKRLGLFPRVSPGESLPGAFYQKNGPSPTSFPLSSSHTR
jgi:hypothetical protein